MSTIESTPTPTADDMIELEPHANWRAEDIGDVDEWTLDVEVVPARLVTDVVGPHGVMPMGPPAARAECGVAAGLLRNVAM